jgi:hypothetical protein
LEHGSHPVQLLAKLAYLYIMQVNSVGAENDRLEEALVILVLSYKATKCPRNIRCAS